MDGVPHDCAGPASISRHAEPLVLIVPESNGYPLHHLARTPVNNGVSHGKYSYYYSSCNRQ